MPPIFTSLPPALQILLQVIQFVIPYLVICYISSWISGWQTLAWRYHTRRKIFGEPFYMQSAAMGLSSYIHQTAYHGCLTIVANSEGIFVVPMLIFRFGHAPLFIPWSHLRIGEWEFLWVKYPILTISNDSCTKFVVSKEILKYKLEAPKYNPVTHGKRK
jgi:hypothetical protein